ncbi:MAG: phasin family protein [Nevskiales bacterium]
MYTKSEQFSELQRKNMETGMKLAQMSLDNSQRIVALQVEVAKKLFQDSVENAKALAAAKDPQQAVALQTQFAQEATKRMMETAREIAEIGNASRNEFSHLLSAQLASGSKDMMSAFQSFFTALPGQNTNVIDAMKQAMSTATGAFEQFSQASSAFTKPAAPAKAASKKK